ncbi:MAG: hypothetical protein ABSE84_06900, partial [Isosphaeraceae bacterium]
GFTSRRKQPWPRTSATCSSGSALLSDEVDLPFVQANLDGLLDRSREGLKRIQKIVENLRDFAHLDEAESKEADLSAGVTATVNILHELAARRHVTLETELPHVPKLNCYPAKINMVVQNLVLNAIDACSAGGRAGGKVVVAHALARRPSRSRSSMTVAASIRPFKARCSTPSSRPSRWARERVSAYQ